MSSEDQNTRSGPLFRNLTADDPDPETTEVESLCLSCGENGITRLLLTKIPFHKEMVLSSFSCSHCGFSNNETQFAGKIQERGICVSFKVKKLKDLDRQVVKSDYSSIKIPEIDFEIPALSQKGEITTVEGILKRVSHNLENDQIIQRALDPDRADKIDEFLSKLRRCLNLDSEFTFIINDPSGNSFIENPVYPHADENLKTENYLRNLEESKLLGILDDEATELSSENKIISPEKVEDEVLTFPTNCPSCNAPCETNMKVTKIPLFKEVVIMATTCDSCGHRTNEVKSGSGTEELGVRIKLEITDPSDMTRDLLKSETCGIIIPELDFEMGAGTLGGKFTTVEGLLCDIKEQLLSNNPLITGDSAQSDTSVKLKGFVSELEKVISCKLKAHIILDDPAGNSYMQNLYSPEPDPTLEITKYERTFEQNEELGINDMKTENYQTS